MVSGVVPAGMGLRVTFAAGRISHQPFLGDELAVIGARQRGLEIAVSGSGCDSLLSHLLVPEKHSNHHHDADQRQLDSGLPADFWSCKSVKDEEPPRHHRGRYMGDVEGGSPHRRTNLDDPLDPGEQDSRDQQDEAHAEESHPGSNSSAIGMPPGVPQVPDAEDHQWDDEEQAEDQVDEKHPLVERILQ